jgi:hypothetical protein
MPVLFCSGELKEPSFQTKKRDSSPTMHPEANGQWLGLHPVCSLPLLSLLQALSMPFKVMQVLSHLCKTMNAYRYRESGIHNQNEWGEGYS